jgi:hypothetical protein
MIFHGSFNFYAPRIVVGWWSASSFHSVCILIGFTLPSNFVKAVSVVEVISPLSARWHVVQGQDIEPKSPVSLRHKTPWHVAINRLVLLGKSTGKPHRNNGEIHGSGVDFPNKTNLLIATNLVSSPPGHAWDLGDPARPKITPVRSINQPSSCGFYVPYFSVLHPLSSMVHTHIFIYILYTDIGIVWKLHYP